MKTKRAIIVVIIVLVALLISCNSNIKQGPQIGVPILPNALTGQKKSQSRSTKPTYEELEGIYGEYIVVPQIGNNYNDWIEYYLDLLQNYRENEKWKRIAEGPFVRQLNKKFKLDFSDYPNSGDGMGEIDLVIREDAGRTLVETHFYMDETINSGPQNPTTETKVLIIKENDNYSHATLFMMNTSGEEGNHDSIEILQSNKVTLTKCVREFLNIEGFTEYFHFVAISDRTKVDNNTTGLFKYKYTDKDLDYGYFNDTDLRDKEAEPNNYPNIEPYLDFLFNNGLSESVVSNIEVDSYKKGKNLSSYKRSNGWEHFNNFDWNEEQLKVILKIP